MMMRGMMEATILKTQDPKRMKEKNLVFKIKS
jgi:hypothetical protein